MLFCAPIIGLWYWCTDQYIVQRALGAPNETQARRGSIFAAILKLLPVFIFIIPGMICFALATSGRSEALQAEMFKDGKFAAENAQAAFPLMVKHILPVGVRGIVVAGLLSALMSSLAGVFKRLVDALYDGFLPALQEERLAARAGLDGAGRDDRDGHSRARLGPGDPGLEGPLPLPPERAGLSRPADFRRVLLRRIDEAAERQGLPGRP